MTVQEASLETTLEQAPLCQARTTRRSLAPAVDGSAADLVDRLTPWLGRIALALVYAWFGALKVVGVSPAAGLVFALQSETLPFLDRTAFLVGLGWYEVLVGVLLLIGWRRTGLALLGLHMVATFLPLVLLPAVTWHGFAVLTIEGQYIVKNVVIVALALALVGQDSRTRVRG